MALAEGVVDLGQHCGQAVVGTFAKPETDRLEGVTGDAREALQPDLAVGLHALALQQRLGPGQRVVAPLAVVGVTEADPGAPVARQQRLWAAPQRTHRQQVEEGRVAEAVRAGRQAPVQHRSATEQGHVHVAALRICWRSRAWAADRPDISPSSWNP